MVTPSAGAVVLVPFPFSDLSDAKLRPAIALADAGRGDWILCQVTSNPYGDSRAVHLTQASFGSGALRIDSYARPGKLFTASQELMVAQVAVLTADAREDIVRGLCALSVLDTQVEDAKPKGESNNGIHPAGFARG